MGRVRFSLGPPSFYKNLKWTKKMYQYKAKVLNVVDGDTIDVSIDLGLQIHSIQRIRLYGIDTPERGQPGFSEATDRLKQLILNKNVLIKTYKISKYGQYLGEIMFDEMNINQMMITEGHAKKYFGGIKE
jgi:micrococcal nuclease